MFDLVGTKINYFIKNGSVILKKIMHINNILSENVVKNFS